MNSLYIHIPFCRRKCFYCDFYAQVLPSASVKDDYVSALIKEIDLQKDYLPSKKLDTIYFGGGTPSLLEISDFEKIFKKIFDIFSIKKFAEITIEANPEDLTFDYLKNLKNFTPINRLSIGVQSFYDEHLKFLNRNHNSETAISAILNAKKNNFENISVDLIFGFKGLSIKQWENNLLKLTQLPIKHFSAYSLIIEEGSLFYFMKQKGKQLEATEEEQEQMYLLTIDFAHQNDFIHYEISNFAKPKFISRHNWNYWTGGTYLGLGASAHSYNGYSRQYNVANFIKYILSINKGFVPMQKEVLTDRDFFNEYIITRLRTYKGLNINELKRINYNYYRQILPIIEDYLKQKLLIQNGNFISLSEKGFLISDTIFRDLIIV